MGLLPDERFVVNPTVQQMELSQLDLVMAGTDSAVLMIEGYCDFLTEEQMLEVGQLCLSQPCSKGCLHVHAQPWKHLMEVLTFLYAAESKAQAMNAAI